MIMTYIADWKSYISPYFIAYWRLVEVKQELSN